jgi:hypothetical protein
MSILVLTSDTLIGTPATGNIEYSGQFYGTDSNASRAQIQRITQGTAVASTSGTSITFSSIPSWVKRITVMLNGVSTSGTSPVLLQIGSGSVTTTGYVSGTQNAATFSSSTAGYIFEAAAAAADTIYGFYTLCLISGNAWTGSGNILKSGTNVNANAGVSAALGGALDRVVITTVGGTDTFDAGSINILYEG